MPEVVARCCWNQDPTQKGIRVSLIDLHGFVANLKDHVSEHGFHVHGDRHFVET